MEKNFTQVYSIKSKEFWRNYWFYYKPHTLWGLAIAIVMAFTIHGCVTKVEPDFSILYIGKSGLFTNEPAEPILEKYINDINGDEKKSVLITNLSLGDEKDIQMTQASLTKADLELSVGDPSLFVCDDAIIERYVAMEGFEDISQLTASLNIPDERLLKNDKTNAVLAVDITGTEFARTIGVVAKSKVYIGVKVMPLDKKNNEKYAVQHKEVIRMCEFILKDKFE